jgi:hypothetical protein
MVVEKVGGGRTYWPIGHMARPTGHHMESYRLGQVGGAPPGPYKYPLTSENRHTHTHTTFWRFNLKISHS